MSNLDEKLVEKYFVGNCSEAEIMQILEWLNASEANRNEWLKLRMVSASHSFRHFSDSEYIAGSYQELIEKQKVRKRIKHEITRKIHLQFLCYAASILLLIGMSVIVYKYFTDWQYPKMVVVETGEHENVRHIMLEDGTQVWLSANSRIEYPERFGKTDRIVSVEGKVYFEVAKDANRPYYVKTETYTVKVLGTSFEVNAFKYSQTSDVTLVEGNVEILDNHMKSLCTLLPGQQFETDKISNHLILHQIDAELYTSWHGGKFVFDGLTFTEIAKVLERQYNVQIIIEDSIAQDQRLVGSLSFQKDIYQMMRTLELVVPIKYLVKTDTIIYIQTRK